MDGAGRSLVEGLGDGDDKGGLIGAQFGNGRAAAQPAVQFAGGMAGGRRENIAAFAAGLDERPFLPIYGQFAVAGRLTRAQVDVQSFAGGDDGQAVAEGGGLFAPEAVGVGGLVVEV